MHSAIDNKYVISEFYDFKADKELIREAIENNTTITIKCILQKANTLNRNGRVYPFPVLKKEVDKYMAAVQDRSAMGELDHPDSAVISLNNVSHLITKMWWEQSTLWGEIEIAETPSGDIVKGLLRSGIKLGISSRGVGSVKTVKGEDVVQEDFELIGFDIVSSPSTPGAYLFKEGRQWGLTKLCDAQKTVLKQEDIKSRYSEVYNNIINLSNDSFWKNNNK